MKYLLIADGKDICYRDQMNDALITFALLVANGAKLIELKSADKHLTYAAYTEAGNMIYSIMPQMEG